MKKVIIFLILLCLGVAVVLFLHRPSLPREVVADVNGERIGVAEFTQELFSLVEEGAGSDCREAQDTLEELKSALLDRLVEKKLIFGEARKMGISINDEELEECLAYLRTGYPAGSFQEVVRQDEELLSRWRDSLRERLIIEKVRKRIVALAPPIDESIVRKYYEGHREEFVIPEQVRARQIVVPDLKTAELLMRKLESKESFEELAKEYSVGPEAEAGGDLGFFGKGEMPEEFEVVFSLPTSGVSSIVQSPYGYHIFQVVEKRARTSLTFEDVKDQVTERVVRERHEGAFQNWLAEIKKGARIAINQKVLKEIGVSRGEDE